MMPTAARLIAVLVLAFVGFFGAASVLPHLPEGHRAPWLWAIACAVAVLVGWLRLGPDAERRCRASIQAQQAGRRPGDLAAIPAPKRAPFRAMANGLKAVIVLVVGVLLVTGLVDMLGRALARRYDGPVQALQDMVSLMLTQAQLLQYPDVAGMLVVGGLVAGLLTDWAARRFS